MVPFLVIVVGIVARVRRCSRCSPVLVTLMKFCSCASCSSFSSVNDLVATPLVNDIFASLRRMFYNIVAKLGPIVSVGK